MRKYGIFARTKEGKVRLCTTTEAEDSVQAGLKLQTWADAVLGDTFWYVAPLMHPEHLLIRKNEGFVKVES